MQNIQAILKNLNLNTVKLDEAQRIIRIREMFANEIILSKFFIAKKLFRGILYIDMTNEFALKALNTSELLCKIQNIDPSVKKLKFIPVNL